ncbi:MAG: hypothetical protein IPI23_19315 [Bacteroidetes bacterium]|nr:hypothetical protein [Bacteroidota bacterium]
MTQLEALNLAKEENEKYSQNTDLRRIVPKGQRTLANYRGLIEINPVKKGPGVDDWDVEYTLMKSEWELQNHRFVSTIPTDLTIKLTYTDFNNDYESYM